jgi:hypothetical protein
MVATLPANALAAFKAYDRNLRWAKAHGAELERFEEEFVAVENEEVIGHDDDQKALAATVRGRVGIYIMFVPKKGLIWIL